MADLEGTFFDDSGQARLEGRLNVPDGIDAGFLNGVAINNTPSGDAEVLITVDASNAAWGTLGDLADATSGGTKPSVADIANPAAATAEDVANALNALLAALGASDLGLITVT
jgi:hypothetical protein